MDQIRKKPTKWFYGLALVPFMLGSIIFVYLLLSVIQGFGREFIRFAAPGEHRFNLPERGKYMIYYEHHSIFNNKVYVTSESVSGLRAVLIKEDSGEEIRLVPVSMSTNYSYGPYAGLGLWEFEVRQPGYYRLSVFYDEENGGPEVVLALGQNFFKSFILKLALSIAIFFASFMLSVVFFVIILVKRNKKIPARG